MHRTRGWVVIVSFVCLLACPCCGAGASQSNGAKMGEALAFAAVAGAAQVAQAAIAENARNASPRAAPCGDDGQFTCYYSAALPPSDDDPPPDMTEDEGRQYTLEYLNGVRRLNGVDPLVLDPGLSEFAQAGSLELSEDHRIHQHFVDHGSELGGAGGENQGDPTGSPPGPLQDQIAVILGTMMREGPGGGHHDNLLRPEWHRLGVGIVNPGGRMYFTTDFAI